MFCLKLQQPKPKAEGRISSATLPFGRSLLKFRCSWKATIICKESLTFFELFVAFSEYLNFITNTKTHTYKLYQLCSLSNYKLSWFKGGSGGFWSFELGGLKLLFYVKNECTKILLFEFWKLTLRGAYKNWA